MVAKQGLLVFRNRLHTVGVARNIFYSVCVGGGGGGYAAPTNKSAEQIGKPIFQQNRFPVPWISVPGPNPTSFRLLCSWGHVETQNIS